MKNIIIVIVLLSIFTSLAITSMIQKSGTPDEIAHQITSGVIMLKKGDLKYDTAHPPLARYIIAAPVVLFLNPKLPDKKQVWRVDDRAEFARDFFFKYNNQSKQMLFVSRLMVVMLGVLCGLLIFLWTKKLYGVKVALFSLFLYVLSPNILAHTRLATTDLAAAFFILLSCYAYWLFFKNSNKLNLILAGLCLGLAQLTKFSALILYPIFTLLFFIYLPKVNRAKRKKLFLGTAAIFFLSIIIIWAGYGFSREPLLKDAMRQQEKLELIDSKLAVLLPVWNDDIREKINSFLLNEPIPCSEYILGILGLIRHNKIGHGTYFLGKHSGEANILYFPVAFLIKTPIPLILLLIIGIFVLVKNRFTINEYFLILPPAIYFSIAIFSNIQIGLRHILPIYPFLFIIAASSLYMFRYKAFKLVISVLCLWYVVSSFAIWPDYLSYFNESIGRADNGWRYLADSNIDWGQDLPALSRYMADNEIEEVTMKYFGQDAPDRYGIDFKEFETEDFQNPQEEVYAISVNSVTSIDWARNRRPTAKAGKSIFIYDLRNRE
ncbi:MAG: phospholipid carrier-dependent glycosyltransferase [Candidatus Orphnella occulta]|nr:phospholipid carrier-dependent glycosyltransferase [Candidatus Orphnella occulta]